MPTDETTLEALAARYDTVAENYAKQAVERERYPQAAEWYTTHAVEARLIADALRFRLAAQKGAATSEDTALLDSGAFAVPGFVTWDVDLRDCIRHGMRQKARYAPASLPRGGAEA